MVKKAGLTKKVRQTIREFASPNALFVRASEKDDWAFVGGFIKKTDAIEQVRKEHKDKYTQVLGLWGGTKFESNPWTAYLVNERTEKMVKVWGIGPESLHVAYERLPISNASSRRMRHSLIRGQRMPRITPKTPRLKR